MLNPNTRTRNGGIITLNDLLRYQCLALDISNECLNLFLQYLEADVSCQKLTEALEGLYYALTFYFYLNNIIEPLGSKSSSTKFGEKRPLLFEKIWPNITYIVNAVLDSYAGPRCGECGPRSSVMQCLCLDRIIVMWRIVYL